MPYLTNFSPLPWIEDAVTHANKATGLSLQLRKHPMPKGRFGSDAYSPEACADMWSLWVPARQDLSAWWRRFDEYKAAHGHRYNGEAA